MSTTRNLSPDRLSLRDADSKSDHPAREHGSSQVSQIDLNPGMSFAGDVVQEALRNLGLTPNEAKIYIHLLLEAPRAAGEISVKLGIHRTETYNRLATLEKQGVIETILSNPLRFSAVPLEKTLKLLTDAEHSLWKVHDKERNRVCELWNSIPKIKLPDPPPEKMQVLQGLRTISVKAKGLIQRAKEEVSILASEFELARLYHQESFDSLEKLRQRSVALRILSTTHLQGTEVINYLESVCLHPVFQLTTPPTTRMSPTLILADKKELLFFLNHPEEAGDKVSAFYTNYSTLTMAAEILFSSLLASSTSAVRGLGGGEFPGIRTRDFKPTSRRESLANSLQPAGKLLT